MDRPTRRTDARRSLAVAMFAVSAAWLVASTASAMQGAESTPPPQPEKGLTLISPVLGYFVMAVAAAAVISASLIPSKRGSQD